MSYNSESSIINISSISGYEANIGRFSYSLQNQLQLQQLKIYPKNCLDLKLELIVLVLV